MQSRGSGVAVTIMTKPPKGASLAYFTRFEPLGLFIHVDPFTIFFLWRAHEKNGQHKKSQRGYFHLFAENSPLNQI